MANPNGAPMRQREYNSRPSCIGCWHCGARSRGDRGVAPVRSPMRAVTSASVRRGAGPARNGIERIRLDVRRFARHTASICHSDTTGSPIPSRHLGRPALRQFAYVRFTTPAARLGSAWPDRHHAATLTRIIAPTHSGFPGADELWQQNIDIPASLYTYGNAGNRPGTGRSRLREGLFRVSEEAMAQVRRTAVKPPVRHLIVLATTLLLYP